jgi:hypothetical protein
LGGGAFCTNGLAALWGDEIAGLFAEERGSLEAELLVASDTPGRAMRAQDPAPGTVIGKALEPCAAGQGLIMMLVMNR